MNKILHGFQGVHRCSQLLLDSTKNSSLQPVCSCPAFVFTFETSTGMGEGKKGTYLQTHLLHLAQCGHHHTQVAPDEKYGDLHLLSKKWRCREVKPPVQGATTRKRWRWFSELSFALAMMTSRIGNTFFFFGDCELPSPLLDLLSLQTRSPTWMVYFYLPSYQSEAHLGTNISLKRIVSFLEASDCQEILEHSEGMIALLPETSCRLFNVMNR